MEQTDIEAAKRVIVEAVQTRWSQPQPQAYLLSQLGKDLPDEVRTIARGRKLLDVLRSEFADSLTVTSKGVGGDTIWAIAPSSVEAREAARQIPTAIKPDNVRFAPALWAAFRVPLEAGKARFVIQQGSKFRFEDLPEGASVPDQFVLKLGASDISSPAETPLEISQRIERLLAARAIPLGAFATGRSVAAEGSTTPSHLRQSLLDELLSCLSVGEARRVSLPLDVVEKLRTHIVGRH